MSEDPSFKMSQDYELVPPKKKRAYPILVEEWESLKRRIAAIDVDVNMYHTIGSLLLGVSGSALLAAISLGNLTASDGKLQWTPALCWLMFVATLICGALALFFGRDQRAAQKAKAGNVLEQMELIEKRYVEET